MWFKKKRDTWQEIVDKKLVMCEVCGVAVYMKAAKRTSSDYSLWPKYYCREHQPNYDYIRNGHLYIEARVDGDGMLSTRTGSFATRAVYDAQRKATKKAT